MDPFIDPLGEPSQLDELIFKAINASLNSRQARRERILCALISNRGLKFFGEFGYSQSIEESLQLSEEILDASDAVEEGE